MDPLPLEEGEAGEGDNQASGYLINPRCKVDGSTPERRKTKHLYIKLDTLEPQVKKWVDEAKRNWSSNCTSITESFMKQGLQSRGITRDLSWGVPIPKGLKGLDDSIYASKVFYVWFDACSMFVVLLFVHY
jgi:methionyl-tRNA synthetase